MSTKRKSKMDPIKVTFAGDSITDMDNSWSWLNFMPSDFVNDGGVAESGKTSAQILAASALVAKPYSNVLVICLGTNDVRYGTSTTTVKQNIKAIADKVGAHHTVIVALPPSNLTDYKLTPTSPEINRAVQNYVMNRSIEEYAVRQGWQFVNPWTFRAQQDGTWASGASQSDGVHPQASTVENYAGPAIYNAARIAVQGTQV